MVVFAVERYRKRVLAACALNERQHDFLRVPKQIGLLLDPPTLRHLGERKPLPVDPFKRIAQFPAGVSRDEANG